MSSSALLDSLSRATVNSPIVMLKNGFTSPPFLLCCRDMKLSPFSSLITTNKEKTALDVRFSLLKMQYRLLLHLGLDAPLVTAVEAEVDVVVYLPLAVLCLVERKIVENLFRLVLQHCCLLNKSFDHAQSFVALLEHVELDDLTIVVDDCQHVGRRAVAHLRNRHCNNRLHD